MLCPPRGAQAQGLLLVVPEDLNYVALPDNPGLEQAIFISFQTPAPC